jgi:uracil-DNA glycosylase
MSSLDIDRQTSLEWPPAPVPAQPTHATLARAVQHCRACELWEGATQALIGQGAAHARVMLVGEQPGARDDIEGHPSVGQPR